jgi:hypothetical protein
MFLTSLLFWTFFILLSLLKCNVSESGSTSVIRCKGGKILFTIPSIVNLASAVNRALARNCRFTAHFEKNHWQNTTHAWCSVGVKACCGKGKVILHGDFSRQGEPDTFSSCNSTHTASGIFFHSSQYAIFSKARPYLSWLKMSCSFKWVL